nr:MAG TPA: hypothetical protein [Caudoviricetes sp.]
MSTTNLGRVQGAGFFYTTASSGTSIALSTITPTSIKPLVGDCVIFPNGDLRKVTAVSTSAVTCGDVVASFKGAKGENGGQEIYQLEVHVNNQDPPFSIFDGCGLTDELAYGQGIVTISNLDSPPQAEITIGNSVFALTQEQPSVTFAIHACDGTVYYQPLDATPTSGASIASLDITEKITTYHGFEYDAQGYFNYYGSEF